MLVDLQDDIAEDLYDANVKSVAELLSEAEKERLIKQLEEYRDLQETGVRATNKAAALDCYQTVKNMGDEVRRKVFQA